MSLIFPEDNFDVRGGWRCPVRIPQHAHPLVREFIRIANREQATMKDIAQKAGISEHTIKGWRLRHKPAIDTFEAALNVLDFKLCIRSRGYGE